MNTRDLHFASNRMRDVIALFRAELVPLYPMAEIDVFVELLAEHILGWDKVKLLLARDSTIDQSDLLRFHWALHDLHLHRPIQHILGHVDFAGCRLEVNPDVLIPRPETEEMVLHIIAGGSRSAVLDLCTGSGCIAIALKRAWSEADVVAVDSSTAALSVAQRNAAANATNIRLLEADVLRWQPQACYDLIVSNPPYVRLAEREQMRRNVLDYEPAQALFVPDDDPLLFYRAILAIAQQSLFDGGVLVVEINEVFAVQMQSLLEGGGFAVQLHDDFRGRPRWIEAKRVRAAASPL